MKKLNWIRKSVVLLLMLLPTVVVAGQEKGGGDESGIQAAASLRQAVLNLSRYGEKLLTKAQLAEVKNVTSKLVILMVDNELPVQANGVTQNGVAYSQSGEALFLTMIKRDRWAATKDQMERQAIMAHEVFVLTGIESTGTYTYSGEFLRLLKADPESLTEPTSGAICELVKGTTEYHSRLITWVYYSVFLKTGKGRLKIAETTRFVSNSKNKYNPKAELQAFDEGVALIKEQVKRKTCTWDGSAIAGENTWY